MAKGMPTMIELNTEQQQAVTAHPGQPLRLVDPATREAFVLLRADEYERLFRDAAYDASPWTDEEMHLLAGEDADRLGWEGLESYQDPAP
jgi:hypothetical protein